MSDDQRHNTRDDEPLPSALTDYFARRQQERQAQVQRMWSLLKPRDQRLVREAAVMGYVLGERFGLGRTVRDNDFPTDSDIVAQVLLACEGQGDLYPTFRRLARRVARVHT